MTPITGGGGGGKVGGPRLGVEHVEHLAAQMAAVSTPPSIVIDDQSALAPVDDEGIPGRAAKGLRSSGRASLTVSGIRQTQDLR